MPTYLLQNDCQSVACNHVTRRVTFIHHHHRYHQSIDRFGRLGEIRDNDTEIFLKSGLLCAAGSNSSIVRYANSLIFYFQLSANGIDLDLPLARPGKQSCKESRAW
ncbi:hypothetical protein DPMN_177527 [Dreissena polymorpha]|uniref:Uncharacterized protein n=1 Tax=Dreissena polymorpha TaxID=45954 RepID=A0A9D4EB67_DREPO|nr:hypothetical protein DPMN_177527 [Dreissena polymorpha]